MQVERTGRTLTSRRTLLGVLFAAPCLSVASCSPWEDLPPLPPADTRHYVLGPGDHIRIITFGEQQLTGEFRVDASGGITLPLVGTVQAAGLTPQQLDRAVERALSKSDLYRNPSVSVEVIDYRPIFVLGEVVKPGEFPYQPGMTVITAIAISGGFTYRAVLNHFSVVRTTAGKSVEGVATRATPLQPGDVVTVYERVF